VAANGMEGNPTTEWLTYAEAGERLGVSPEAIRARAIRGHWRRQVGNDGLARVMVPAEILRAPDQRPVNGRSTPVRKAGDPATLNALREHNETLKGEVELLKGQLVIERERGDRVIADLAGERAEHQEQLAAAMSQLVELARRLAAIAETQTSAEPEPPRHWAIRAWRWMQKAA
jgi:hypothetical protein